MSFSRVIASCLFALLLVPAVTRAAQVSATLDRSQAQLGDTVTLNVRVAGAADNVAMPDLSPLDQDFDVLGASQSSSLSVINGKSSSSLTIGIALRPKHVGTLQIPPLDVAGEQTAALQLEVSAPNPADAQAPNRAVFMEAGVEPQRGYVGEQFSFVVKLFYANNLSGGAINIPSVKGVELNQVGKDLGYDTERNGRTYHVLERRYAVVPQQPGHVEIPAANFQGNAIDPNDPNSFFGATDNVTVNASAVSIEVQAAPSDWGNNAWLPARDLSLSLDGWPGAQQQVRVGQPLNLSMTLQATGLAADTLPALSLPPLDGATTYPDKPVTHDHVDGQWVVGQRQQAFAIVPERAGVLTIPATTLKWWNVLADKMEVAQIPAHSITILPAIGGTAQPSSPAPSTSIAPGVTASHTSLPASPPVPWRWIALGSVLLWVGSLLAWWLWHRHRRHAPRIDPTPAPASARQAQLAFMTAARSSNVAAQARCLLDWARAERPGIQHLGELSAAIGDASQRTAIDDLQRRQYGGASATIDTTRVDLAEAFKRGFAWRSASEGDGDEVLPPLYPFKLH